MDTNYEFLLLLSQCMSFESLFMCILLACLSVTDINVYLQSGQKPTQAAGIATGHCCFPSKQVCKNTKTEYRLSTLISFTEPCQVHVKKNYLNILLVTAISASNSADLNSESKKIHNKNSGYL